MGHGHSHGGDGKAGFSKSELVTLVVETLEPLEIKNGLLMLLLLVDGERISPAMGYTLGSTNQPSPFDSRAL